MIAPARFGAVVAVAILVAGCGIAQVDRDPDPARIATGPAQPMGGEEPTGPVAVVGSGRTLGIGWRYVVFTVAGGVCTQLETSVVSSGGCGTPGPAEGSVFGSVGHGAASGDGPNAVEGMVTDTVEAVSIEGSDGREYATTLMSLEPAGLGGRAFVGFVAANVRAVSVTALGPDGDVIETFALD